jgi:phosphoglycerol transferase
VSDIAVRPETVPPEPPSRAPAPDAPPPASTSFWRRAWVTNVRDGLIVTGATSAIVAWLFRDRPLRVPFLYQRDGISQIVEVKSIIQHGWYEHNPQLGWPIGLDHRDFPLGTDNLQYTMIKAIGQFSKDPVLVTNLYYLLSFVLVALSAYFVIRYLGVSRRFSFLTALLFTFLPYHFLRGTWHLMLASYYSVPIACLLVILVWSDNPPFFRSDGDRARLSVTNRRALWCVVACIVIGSSGLYYAVFGLVLMASGAFLYLLRTRRVRALFSSAILAALVFATMLINIAPSILYHLQAGGNSAVAQRSVQESDFYALLPVQMLSPIPGYRIGFIGHITNVVLSAPNNSEATQFLGIIASLGFISLVLILLARARSRSWSSQLLEKMGALVVIAVFFGVTGGLSWIPGMVGLAQIRAWNRISVFIAFFALVAVGIWLDRFVRWSPRSKYKAFAASALAIVLLGIGIFDQTSPAIVPNSRNYEAEWNNDAAFVSQIDHTMPKGSAIFQLPYLPYPEAELQTPPYGMVDYDPFRGYLHSDDLNWSYGGMRGRASDWQAQVVKLSVPEMLDAITAVGFHGLWVDRLGYPNHAADIEAQIQDATGVTPIVSENGRFAFYDLRPYAQQVEARLGASGVRELRAETLRNVR